MVESHWTPLDGKELRYGEQTWELTGTVDVLNSGELLAVEATETDDVRKRRANLYFSLDGRPESLNPGKSASSSNISNRPTTTTPSS